MATAIRIPDPAPRARSLATREEWNHRAIELAYAQHTVGTLRYQSTDADGNHFYSCSSRSHADQEHMLLINLERGITKYNQNTFCAWEPITERVREGSRL